MTCCCTSAATVRDVRARNRSRRWTSISLPETRAPRRCIQCARPGLPLPHRLRKRGENLGERTLVSFHVTHTLGRARWPPVRGKNLNGTNVVPKHRRDVHRGAPRARRFPRRNRSRGCASSSLPNPYGSTIWPACRCPARGSGSQRPHRHRVRVPRGKWPEQNPQVLDADRRSRFPSSRSHEPRSTPRQLDALAAQLHHLRLVEQHRPVLKTGRARPGAKTDRVRSRNRDCRARTYGCDSFASSASNCFLSAWAGQEITGDCNEDPAVTLRHPVHRALGLQCRPRDGTPRWKSERCGDAQAVELGGKPGSSSSSQHAGRTQPASNQPYAATTAASATSPASQSKKGQIWSFSMTGSTENDVPS